MRKKTIVVLGSAGALAGLSVVLIFYLGTITSRACPPPVDGREVTEMHSIPYFSTDYRTARRRFLATAQDVGASTESFENPRPGPDGDPVYTDVALIGPDDARTIFVLSSGTHGVEGFAGSGLQTGLLREDPVSRLPAGVRLVMIHGINPYGMAHLRRFNEDNVDLNRNFPRHFGQLPDNRDYEALADVMAPRSLSVWSDVVAWFRLLSYRVMAGKESSQAAVQRGQYTHPKGLFYGGTFETWSNTTIRSVAQRYLSSADRVVIVDVHTGLGEFGSAEVILNDSVTAPNYLRAVAIWGPELVKATTEESVSGHLDASLKRAFPTMVPEDVEVTAVTLEFGTLPPLEVFKALRAENWLHHYGRDDDPRAEAIKACLLRAFHPESDEWEAAVWNQGNEVVEKALAWIGRVQR